MKDRKTVMEEHLQWWGDFKAKQEADAKLVETEMAKDPRIALIPASLRIFFLRDTAGEEREKLLSFFQRQADKKANQLKSYWQFWKH